MTIIYGKYFLPKIIVPLLILCIASCVLGQRKCFGDAELKNIIASVNAPAGAMENAQLRRELLEMQVARQKLNLKIINDWEKNEKSISAVGEMGEAHLRRVCEIVKTSGWLRQEIVGEDGLAAALFLIRNGRALDLQTEFLPILAAAAKKGLIKKDSLAVLADTIRVAANLPQLFGTQTEIRDEVFYLYPLQNEAKVDEWRKLYDLPPLAVFIKDLETRYRMIVVKTPRSSASPPILKTKSLGGETEDIALGSDADSEVVKIETNLVNLNVKIFDRDSKPFTGVFEQSDFAVYEDDREQKIEFFSTADAPFDLVLLLDLSGSTKGKKGLIKKSARRFVEAARSSDRIAVVAFSHEAKIVSNFTADKKSLLKSVDKIDLEGGSKVWNALRFAFDNLIEPDDKQRRRAVVWMTDGVDNSLIVRDNPANYNVSPAVAAPKSLLSVAANGRENVSAPSETTFTELLEIVRRTDTTVIPIYLDTETLPDGWVRKAYRSARRSLSIIAEESGGQMYYARSVKDLSGVYERIINYLSQVYSIGYQPQNNQRDNVWRSLRVEIKNRPNLVARAKTGFYAK